MAETTKRTTRRTTSRAKKATTKTVEATTVDTNTNELIAQLMVQIEAQNKQMAELQELQEQINSKQTVVVQNATDTDKFGTKKIKCINLMHNPVNISTEPNGNGKVYTFEKYGDSRLIRFDEIADIVSAYPNTMEKGYIYIANKEVVEALGLSEDYENVYDKETMDKLIMLREEVDLELFLGLDDNLMESTALEIAKRINANEQVDYNYLARIKAETKYDIISIAEDLKKATAKSK